MLIQAKTEVLNKIREIVEINKMNFAFIWLYILDDVNKLIENFWLSWSYLSARITQNIRG